MAPSLYCSHSSSAGNTMKSQFLSWDMESIKNSYANWSSGKTQKCLEETASWLSFPLSRFCKGRKKQDNYYDLESTYSCESMKIHGNGVNICVFFVHFTDHQSVIYVPCPRSGHPTRASNSVKKGCTKIHPLFQILFFQNSIQKKKGKSWKSLNVKVQNVCFIVISLPTLETWTKNYGLHNARAIWILQKTDGWQPQKSPVLHFLERKKVDNHFQLSTSGS